MHRTIQAGLLSFLVTIGAMDLCGWTAWTWWIIAALIVAWWLKRHAGGRPSAVLLGSSLAMMRLMFLAPMPDMTVELPVTGVVAAYPELSPVSSRFTVRTDAGTLLVRGVPGLRAQYGDEVEVSGRFRGLTQEDAYFRSQGVDGIVDRGMVRILSHGNGSQVYAVIYRFRETVEKEIGRQYPEPEAGLLAGLLVGAKSSLPAEVMTALQNSGLTHIIAISGYNITLLCTVLSTLLFWVPLRWRYIPSILIISAFTVLTGASGSAVRAAVMGILGLTALQTGRIQTMRLTILWAAALMTAWNPLQLCHDASFQLSFVALLGVTEIAPAMQKYFTKIPEKFGIREFVVITTSVHIATVPIIAFLFGRTSLVSPFSNLFAPAAVPYATLIGAVSLMIGALNETLGLLVAHVADLPLKWILFTAQFWGSLPFASHDMQLSAGMMAAWYAGVIVLVTRHTAAEERSAARAAQELLRQARGAGTERHGK